MSLTSKDQFGLMKLLTVQAEVFDQARRVALTTYSGV
jgi:hypothetical protein